MDFLILNFELVSALGILLFWMSGFWIDSTVKSATLATVDITKIIDFIPKKMLLPRLLSAITFPLVQIRHQ